MRIDKRSDENQGNNLSRELFVDMETENTNAEQLMHMDIEEDETDDEEPVDNSQE